VIDQAGYLPTRYLAGADGPPPIGNFSKDLAFELYTIPEPATCGLMLLAFVGSMAVRRRPRTV
jgi:PEP-CTERM motif